MTCRIAGIPVHVHLLTPLFLGLVGYLVGPMAVISTVFALMLHEAAHIWAARRAGVEVYEIEWMPFGGAVRMENLWSVRPAQLIFVALAGPVANALLAVTAMALLALGGFPPAFAARVIEVNLALLIFNLLPALPLDGGRILCGILTAAGQVRAGRQAGIWLGRLLAIALLAVAVWQFIRGGKINLTLPVVSIYILSAMENERRMSALGTLESMNVRASELARSGVLPLRWMLVRSELTALELSRLVRARSAQVFLVSDGVQAIVGGFSDAALRRAMFENVSRTATEMIEFPWPPNCIKAADMI